MAEQKHNLLDDNRGSLPDDTGIILSVLRSVLFWLGFGVGMAVAASRHRLHCLSLFRNRPQQIYRISVGSESLPRYILQILPKIQIHHGQRAHRPRDNRSA